MKTGKKKVTAQNVKWLTKKKIKPKNKTKELEDLDDVEDITDADVEDDVDVNELLKDSNLIVSDDDDEGEQPIPFEFQ